MMTSQEQLQIVLMEQRETKRKLSILLEACKTALDYITCWGQVGAPFDEINAVKTSLTKALALTNGKDT